MIWDLQRRIDEVSEQIVQGTRLSFNETVHIRRYHGSTSSADVEVSFSLRTHTPGDEISVTARGQDGQAHSAVASPLDMGRFVASMNLPLQDNYVFTFTATGDSVTAGELAQFNLADRLCGRLSLVLSHGLTSGPNQPTTVSIYPHFRNYTGGDPALVITSLSIIAVRENGERITAWDLTDYLYTQDSEQMLALPRDRNILTLTVGDGLREIRPDEFTFARLEIRDNLGIRYEQLDEIFFPHQLDHGRGGSAPVPVPARAWHYVDAAGDFGRIRIVE